MAYRLLGTPAAVSRTDPGGWQMELPMQVKQSPSQVQDSGKVQLGNQSPSFPAPRAAAAAIADSGKVRMGSLSPSLQAPRTWRATSRADSQATSAFSSAPLTISRPGVGSRDSGARARSSPTTAVWPHPVRESSSLTRCACRPTWVKRPSPPSLPVCSIAASKRMHPIANGLPASPMSGPPRAGSMWLLCRSLLPARCRLVDECDDGAARHGCSGDGDLATGQTRCAAPSLGSRQAKYSSEQFQRLMADHGVVCSTSRSGMSGTMPRWRASSGPPRPSEQRAKPIIRETRQEPTCSITSNASTTAGVVTRPSDIWAL